MNAFLPDGAFRLLNGRRQDDLDSGAAITTDGWLGERGVPASFLDGYRSWFGRHVAAAYRSAHGDADPTRAWVQTPTTEYWIPAFIYRADDPALSAGARSYRRTAQLLPA